MNWDYNKGTPDVIYRSWTGNAPVEANKTAGIEKYAEEIAKTHKYVSLKSGVPPEALTEGLAKSILEERARLGKSHGSARLPENIFPKAVEAAKKLGFWEKIEMMFKNKKGNGVSKAGGGVIGVVMLGFIIGMELLSGKAYGNTSGLERRMAMGELVGSEYGPELAGMFCAIDPNIMRDVLKGYAGDKEEMKEGLENHFNVLIGLLGSKDIMNELVIKEAVEEYNRQQEEEKKQEVQEVLKKAMAKSNYDYGVSIGFMGSHVKR